MQAMSYPSQERQHKELVETKTRIKNVRWNGSDWNCKKYLTSHLIQIVVVNISEDLKGKLYSFFFYFFFKQFYFFCLYSFIYFILILIFKHKFNKQIKQTNK